ncbi:MAG: NAD(+) synthase [Clostridia bacterium]|nr:NAD(+) synthase [Clostridia bacterium]
MDFGYAKVATFTPEIKVGDVDFNVDSIKKGIDVATEKGVSLIAFPELCLTGSTAGDLFYSKTLIESAKSALNDLANYTRDKKLIVLVGLPFALDGLLYNVCAVISNGMVLGIIPKTYMPNFSTVNESRYFKCADEKLSFVVLDKDNPEDVVPFGKNIIFADKDKDCFKFSVEIGSDVNAIVPPSTYHAVNGARLIVNISADNEQSLAIKNRRELVKNYSNKITSAYILANAGDGESTTDCVYSGHSMIAENGVILAESAPFNNGLTLSQVDLESIDYQRTKNFNQSFDLIKKDYYYVGFSVEKEINVERKYSKIPFINLGEEEHLLNIQAQGLKKRIIHTNSKTVVLGLSGGLDSTLALIVAVKAVTMAEKSLKDIIAVTMPCFGTSSRTLENSIRLAKSFGVTLKKVDITKSVKRHLKDIKHSESVHDAAYENAQARERTQVLMDIANMYNGLVVGTGDLSELALGWATYNGDHMSMYAVNASVPKTLVRHLTNFYAENCKGKLKATLLDILDTPVSPELIPSNDNTIKQVTEDIVGPYILHDFFLYNMLVNGFSPAKIYMVAVNSFKDEFDKETILKWLKTFTRRFFNQQFKRSCMPDGVKVTEISLSPRGAYRMPSDAVSTLWLNELEDIKI